MVNRLVAFTGFCSRVGRLIDTSPETVLMLVYDYLGGYLVIWFIVDSSQ